MPKGQGGRPPMPGGGGGGQGLNQMMKQMQKMQADMAAAQDALAAATVEGSAGGGMVKVVVTGSGEVQSVHIAPEVVDPDDVEMLEDLVARRRGRRPAACSGDAEREPRWRHRRTRPRQPGRPRWSARLTREQPVRRVRPGPDRRVGPPPRGRAEVGAADRVLPPQGGARGRQPPRPGHHRGEGARHLVSPVLQHRRGRAVRVLPRRAARLRRCCAWWRSRATSSPSSGPTSSVAATTCSRARSPRSRASGPSSCG